MPRKTQVYLCVIVSLCVDVSLFVYSCESVCQGRRESVCRYESLCRCKCLHVDVGKMNNGRKDPWGLVSVSAVLAGDGDLQHVHQV